MELPKAVQEQLKRAEEEAQRAMEQSQQTVAVQEPPAEPAEPQVPQQPAESQDEWKKRFDTLQGKYNAEVPRLHQQLQQAQEFARQLAQELAELKQTQEQIKEKATVSAERQLTQDEIDAISEAYGDDIIEFIGKMIHDQLLDRGLLGLKEQVEQVTAAFNQLSNNVSTVGETQQQVAAQQILQQLRARIPEFDEVNSDPAFAEWLQAEDPISGVSRVTIVQDAFSKLDVDRLERLFRLYMDESGFTRKRQEQASRQTAVAQQVTPESVTASDLLAATDPASLDRKVWTQQEYIQVYDPRFVREVGEERAAQLQAAADKAVAEGRIR